MRVVVAEKPDVARNITRVLGCGEKREGYWAGSGWCVTWVFGHLVEIAEPDAMNPAWGRPWTLDQLPMIPEPWRHQVRPAARRQFEVVKKLLNDERTEEVVEATDAGREGEYIFRLIYEFAGCRKPVRRLWVRSMTDKAIRAGFAALRPGSDYDRLAAAARARAHADWLVGINLTRAYTVHNGQLCTIGRVQTPTLALVVARDQEIRGFRCQTFYEIEAVLAPGFSARLVSDGKVRRFLERDQAESLFQRLKPVPAATVVQVEQKDVHVAPPALHDLLSLQVEANKRFGYSAAQTLQGAQTLYESHKLITYPRTESQHLATDMVSSLPGVLKALSDQWRPGRDLALRRLADGLELGKAYVDDAKLTDHHAIIPTGVRAPALPERERNIYDLVVSRFIGIFLEDAVRAETVVWLDLGGQPFRASGSVLKHHGWTMVTAAAGAEESPEEAPPLPPLAKGQVVEKLDLKLVEGRTKPPARYNDGTLLKAMRKAGDAVEDEALAEEMEGRGLGTPATRAGIIEGLVHHGYLAREKRALVATSRGEALITQVLPALKSPKLTAEWEQQLADVENGKGSAEAFEHAIAQHVKDMVPRVGSAAILSSLERGLAPCPVCKSGTILKTSRNYSCSRHREGCRYAVWPTIAGKTLTQAQVLALLVRGRTGKIQGFQSRTGKRFSAGLRLDENHRIAFVFATPRSEGSVRRTPE